MNANAGKVLEAFVTVRDFRGGLPPSMREISVTTSLSLAAILEAYGSLEKRDLMEHHTGSGRSPWWDVTPEGRSVVNDGTMIEVPLLGKIG